MDVLEIVLTMLSMGGGVFAWYQAVGSKKARAEAEAAVERAETQAKAALAQAHEARKQSEAMQKLVDSLQDQTKAAEESALEAKRLANSTAKQTEQVEKIASVLRGPDFVLTSYSYAQHQLTYRGEAPVKVRVANWDELDPAKGLEEEFIARPHDSFLLSLSERASYRRPDCLELLVGEGSEPVSLPFR